MPLCIAGPDTARLYHAIPGFFWGGRGKGWIPDKTTSRKKYGTVVPTETVGTRRQGSDSHGLPNPEPFRSPKLSIPGDKQLAFCMVF